MPAVNVKCPPVPEFVLPTLTLSAPAAPLSATPVAITTLPAAPDAVVPVLSVMPPETPPLVDEPVRRSREPVPAVPSPLDRMMAPEEPAALPAAMPDAMVMAPVAPDAVVPELNSIAPEGPTVAAFADRSVTAPDEPEVVEPLTMATIPPDLLAAVVDPAIRMTCAPSDVLVVPTTAEILPDRPP